ncbi:hypothetical protein Y032_0030g2094 [Ancylostoma ceylanicum]|uniref:Uncharacterized protein n=1 Tax=Ancylostoma ceylanicum TaxID=53326 RepID=A0A016UQQ2_9BILA|nr:hypothetical protein Y032_0030g2094 [Ancylostoma ceylanicum]
MLRYSYCTNCRKPSPSGSCQALLKGLLRVLITIMTFILYPNALLRSYDFAKNFTYSTYSMPTVTLQNRTMVQNE